jgi:cytochrome c553
MKAKTQTRPFRLPSRVSHRVLVVLVFLSPCLLISLSASHAADPGTEFFEKKIRPVLVEHCYKCHSPEAKKPKGGLSLDTREGVRRGGDTGPAVVPGKPGESLLMKAVRYTDTELKMPPKGKLTEAVVADLEKWIAMGAPDPREKTSTVVGSTANAKPRSGHWAYQPVKRFPVPTTKDEVWARNEVDRFILAKLEEKGLPPSGDADRRTLIRRVYFDLIGLPPRPEEIDAFVQDESAEAFVRVVDRLLASAHFGERWGRHWLDVARYAESSGGGRSLLFPDAWRYRDYVIKSFNDDKPYDRFVMEQIAGDLLSRTPVANASGSPGDEPLVATAFLALGPTNYERQDKSILEMDVIDEQLDTLGRVFLGQTIGCARCHDHKFDPIPTRDYYALAGIFKSTQTLIHDNVSRWVDVPLPLPKQAEAEQREHEAKVAALTERLKTARAAEAKLAGAGVKRADTLLKVSELPGIVLDDAQAKKVGFWRHSTSVKGFIGDGYLHDDNAEKGTKTLTFTPDFAKPGRYEVRIAYTPGANRANKVPVHILHLDGEFTGHIDERQSPAIDGRFVSVGTFRFDTSGQWYVIISNEGTDGHVIVDAVQFLPEDQASGERKPPDTGKGKPTRPPEELTSKLLEAELKRLTEAGPKRPVAMGVRDATKIEDCHICIRGNFHNRGEKVQRGFLTAITPVVEAPVSPLPQKQSGRRELAEWLVRPENPLIARVMVNRIWHWLFGVGLVRTVDEFGVTGEPPSHPELLDFLALRFTEDSWSVKRLVRMLVLTRAYQMASTPKPGPQGAGLGGTLDPENRLLWRMNRKRLDAECIRDAMLVVSGQLDRRIGGLSLKPGTTSEYDYRFDDARRSVYTPVLRNKLLELFEAFDFPDPNIVAGRRNVSTVATQALYLLNHPFVMEQARRAAAQPDPAQGSEVQLERAYRTTLGRPPTKGEKAIALKFLAAAGEDKVERLTAWERLYQVLFACVDFRYVE